jgi:hypothetical protein
MRDGTRMTIRLDPAARRKVERLAESEGISMNEALNLLLRQAPDGRGAREPRRRYRLRPRKVGFGFDIAEARRLAAGISDERIAEKLGRRR